MFSSNANNVTQESYTYDGFGRIKTVTDSEGLMVTYSYDDLDRVKTITHPDATTEVYTWDRLDLKSYKDRAGRVTSYAYDAGRNLIQKTDPVWNITIYGYYPSGKLKTLKDPNNNVTTWIRDVEGHVTNKIYADGKTTTITYDNAGRIDGITDAFGQTERHHYWPDDRLKDLMYEKPINATPTIKFVYDPVYPRLVTMRDGTGTTSYAYYPPGQLGAGSVKTEDGPRDSDTLTYTYDELGRRSTRKLDGDLAAEGFTYDKLGRVRTANGFTFGYLGSTEQIASVDYPNGQKASYGYGTNLKDRQLLSILHETGSGIVPSISKFDYAHDVVGNVTGWTQTQNLGESVISRRYNYYNGWLNYSVYNYNTYYTVPGIPVPTLYTYNYDSSKYDKFGNRTSVEIGGYSVFGLISPKTGKPYRGTTTSSVYNNLNQIKTVGAQAVTYDIEGHLARDGSRAYHWNASDQLILLDLPNGNKIKYVYDGHRHLAERVLYNGATVLSDTFYRWCGDRICREDDVVNAHVTRRYGLTEKRGHWDKTGKVITDQQLYYAKDHLGTVRDVTDAWKFTVASYHYDEWGNRTLLYSNVPSFTLTAGYTGHLYDADANLVFAPYRIYDPAAGRWISRDPIGEDGGENLYAYVRNNPLKWVDPLGLSSESAGGQPQPYFPGPFDVFIPGTPANKAFVDTTTKALDSIYNMAKGNRPPGYWPGDKGAVEWGKRNDVDPREAKDRFHKGIKPRCHTPGARDDLSVNPETGDVIDGNGDYAGNLGDDYN